VQQATVRLDRKVYQAQLVQLVQQDTEQLDRKGQLDLQMVQLAQLAPADPQALQDCRVFKARKGYQAA
jgi:hypothetical protein